ncbi:MAG: hypothetical protein ABH856_04935, partial [Patescibacteria group bacterium]
WHPGGDEENEIFSMDELIEKFSLEKVHKAGAIFDLEKLKWFQWQWQRRKHLEKVEAYAKELEKNVKIEEEKRGHLNYHFKDPGNLEKLLDKKAEDLLALCEKYLPKEWEENRGYLKKCILTISEKVLQNPKTAKEYAEFYFTEKSYDKKLLTHEKMNVDENMAKNALTKTKGLFEKLDDFSETKLRKELLKLIEEMKVKNGQILWPLRAALTGESFSPGAFEVASALGKEKALERIEKALALLH